MARAAGGLQGKDEPVLSEHFQEGVRSSKKSVADFQQLHYLAFDWHGNMSKLKEKGAVEGFWEFIENVLPQVRCPRPSLATSSQRKVPHTHSRTCFLLVYMLWRCIVYLCACCQSPGITDSTVAGFPFVCGDPVLVLCVCVQAISSQWGGLVKCREQRPK